jgi:hypothetical protein
VSAVLPPAPASSRIRHDLIKAQRRINDRHICASAAPPTLYVIFTTRTAQIKRAIAREGGYTSSDDKWILFNQRPDGGNTKKQRSERTDEQEEKDW